MKHLFSKENITDFVLIMLAVTVSVIFVIPIVRKFIPKAATTPTTTTTTATPTS